MSETKYRLSGAELIAFENGYVRSPNEFTMWYPKDGSAPRIGILEFHVIQGDPRPFQLFARTFGGGPLVKVLAMDTWENYVTVLKDHGRKPDFK